MIPLFKIAISPDSGERVAEVISSGLLALGGSQVKEFESALRKRIGNPYLATLNSGTSALHLAIRMATDRTRFGGDRAAGVGAFDGDPGEVLSTPLTFEATNWAILANGMRIRWVDVDPATLNVDLDDLARKISPATRAIVVVHWVGYPVDLDRLREIVDQAEAAYGIRPMVIEDCAHAWAATYRGLPLGNHGNISIFSFGPSKHLTSGVGGLIVLPDGELERRVRLLRWFGIDLRSDRTLGAYDVAEWGHNFYLPELNAAIGRANLEYIDEVMRRHRENAAFYDKELVQVPGLEHTERADDREPSFYAYPVKVEDRPSFMRKLADAGIATKVLVRRNDAHSCVEAFAADLPGLDSVYERVTYIPVGWWLSEADRAYIVDTVKSGW
jgi:dTDP-4-amino-4,6-dideoxygalactose transaminase